MIVVRMIGVLLFVGAIVCAISSTIVVSDMIEDINRISGEKENAMFGYPGKLGRIRRKYKTLYPRGARDRLLGRLMVSGLLLFVSAAGLMLAPWHLQ